MQGRTCGSASSCSAASSSAGAAPRCPRTSPKPARANKGRAAPGALPARAAPRPAQRARRPGPGQHVKVLHVEALLADEARCTRVMEGARRCGSLLLKTSVRKSTCTLGIGYKGTPHVELIEKRRLKASVRKSTCTLRLNFKGKPQKGN